jgi:hypothetical protein
MGRSKAKPEQGQTVLAELFHSGHLQGMRKPECWLKVFSDANKERETVAELLRLESASLPENTSAAFYAGLEPGLSKFCAIDRFSRGQAVITIYEQPASKKNGRSNTKTGRSFPSANYARFCRLYTPVFEYIARQLPTERTVRQISFVGGSKVNFDLSNKAESIMDCLVDSGILKDDNWKNVSDLRLYRNVRDMKQCRRNEAVQIYLE